MSISNFEYKYSEIMSHRFKYLLLISDRNAQLEPSSVAKRLKDISIGNRDPWIINNSTLILLLDSVNFISFQTSYLQYSDGQLISIAQNIFLLYSVELLLMPDCLQLCFKYQHTQMLKARLYALLRSNRSTYIQVCDDTAI